MPQSENSPYTNAYALLIGVGEDLPVSVRDAGALRQVLTDPRFANYDPDRVFTLTGNLATRDLVEASLQRLAAESERNPEALVFIYYSGHGGRYRSGDEEEYYFLLHGWDEYRRQETMLPAGDFCELLNGFQSRRMVVLLDCCYADGLEVEGNVFKNAINPVVADTSRASVLDALNGGTGRMFIASCKDNQKSWVLPASDNSLFTEAVLGAIKGFYSYHEPYVHILDLVAGLMKFVPTKAAGLEPPREQHPVLSHADDIDPFFYLCTNRITHYSGKSDVPFTPPEPGFFGDAFSDQELEYIPRDEKEELARKEMQPLLINASFNTRFSDLIRKAEKQDKDKKPSSAGPKPVIKLNRKQIPKNPLKDLKGLKFPRKKGK